MSLLIALGLAGVLIQSSPVAPGAAVSGQVLESGGSTAIPGAEVMLIVQVSRPGPRPFADGPPTTLTDRDGRYHFRDVEAGRYRLMVRKAGFAPVTREPPEVNLAAGEHRDGVNVMLQKGAVIPGRVVDENGEPLAEARVMVLQKAPPGARFKGRDFLIPAGAGAQTNDLGEFRLFGLPPGEYYVNAMALGDFGGRSAGNNGTAMLPTYFPNTSDFRTAQPISVAVGETSGAVEIRMITVPAFEVSGVVIDEAGQPVANALVTLATDETAGAPPILRARWHRAHTDASGKFVLNNVTSSTYTLIAAAPVVISRAPGGSAPGGGSVSFGISREMVSGTVGAGVTTETANGITTEYRDATATRMPITIDLANISDLEVILRPPGR